MCQFFSAISNGNGRVEFFKLEDIVNLMSIENPKNYNWNSHTSIADFIGLKPTEEDKWNKWEYNTAKKSLTADSLVTTDDSEKIKPKIEKYLEGKDLLYLQNLYNGNSGDRNSGDRNSGYWNSGDWNSGDWNSGNGNSGNRNSGNGNSGNGNSGNGNSGCIIGHFSSQKIYFLFNKKCTEEEAKKIYNLNLWNYFYLTKWISESEMTEEEKKNSTNYKVTGGYLKTFTYKEAWANIPKEYLEEVKTLKNFSKKVFKEITGLTI